MKIRIVYGSPCSGKTNYVKSNITENDIVYDYDSILSAVTFNSERQIEKANQHDIVISIREYLINNSKDFEMLDNFYIITTKKDDAINKLIRNGAELIELNTSEEKCIEYLQNDTERKDKSGWQDIIHNWFENNEKEVDMNKRSEYVKTEIRATADGKKLTLRGYPILFNTETTVWDWCYGEVKETILPIALDDTKLDDVYLLVGHNPDNLLGRVGKNMRVEVDETGLFFECELPNTQLARDWYNLTETGIVDGMSFGFYCKDQINESTMTRTITKIDELLEITITPFPAYKEASVVANRKSEIEMAERKAELLEKQKKADAEMKLKREKLLKELEEM